MQIPEHVVYFEIWRLPMVPSGFLGNIYRHSTKDHVRIEVLGSTCLDHFL